MGLGGSQKAEVAWLDKHGIPYAERDVTEVTHEAFDISRSTAWHDVNARVIGRTSLATKRWQKGPDSARQRIFPALEPLPKQQRGGGGEGDGQQPGPPSGAEGGTQGALAGAGEGAPVPGRAP